MKGVSLETLRGVDLDAALIDELATLRIGIFRDWPYLYDGTIDYERQYLAHLKGDRDAAIVIARDGAKVVGPATASPMLHQEPAFRGPLERLGEDPSGFFYFGESVLVPECRGRGIGHAFFDAREGAALAMGARATCFYAVVRQQDHPLRPSSARDLHPFWTKRGYRPLPDAVASYEWKDVDQVAPRQHRLQLWLRRLAPA